MYVINKIITVTYYSKKQILLIIIAFAQLSAINSSSLYMYVYKYVLKVAGKPSY